MPRSAGAEPRNEPRAAPDERGGRDLGQPRWSADVLGPVDVRTSISAVPAASAAPRSARSLDARCTRARAAAATRSGSIATRRAEQGLELGRGRSGPACGRNSKIPPPSLLTTTIRTGASDVAERRERVHVVEEAEVAGDDPGRPAAGRSGADPRRDQAVDPVGAAVGEEQDVGVAAPAGTPPGRGSACSRRCRRARRRRRRRRARRCRPGSVGPVERVELGGDRRLRRALRRRATRRARRAPATVPASVAGERLRERRRARRGRSRRRSASARSSRGRVDDELRRVRQLGEPLAQAACRSASRRSAGRGRARARSGRARAIGS